MPACLLKKPEGLIDSSFKEFQKVEIVIEELKTYDSVFSDYFCVFLSYVINRIEMI